MVLENSFLKFVFEIFCKTEKNFLIEGSPPLHSELDSTFSSIFSKMTKLSNLQNFFFRAFLMLPRLVFRRKKKKFVIKTAVF